MPELPEVESIARALGEVVPGRTIARASVTAPDLYRRGSRRVAWVRGFRVSAVQRLGKAILFRLESGHGALRAMVVHLGMTGRFVFEESGATVLYRGDALSSGPTGSAAPLTRHRHGRFAFEDGARLDYIDPRRFGYFHVGPAEGLAETLGIGPDPFELRSPAFAARLEGRRAPIKSILLNQRVVSGLGNIYVDEALFRAGIHPLTQSSSAARASRVLLTEIRRVLRRAIRHGGTTLRDYRRLDGSRGAYRQRLLVYGREGLSCRRCSGTILKMVLGGRGTHFCPSCQPPVRR